MAKTSARIMRLARDADGNELRLCYRMVVEQAFDGERETHAYGVVVMLETQDEKQTARIKSLTCCEEKAFGFLQLISRNTVTPISLYEIAEDYLAVCT